MDSIFIIDSNTKYLSISENVSSILNIQTKNFISQYEKICFIDNYNEKIHWLPDTIKKIRFEVDYEYPLDNLPSELTKLVFLFECNQKMDNLPRDLEELSLGDSFVHQLINLPPMLQTIKLGNGFREKITQLPPKLKQIIFPSKYKYLSEFKLVWKNFHTTNETHGMITFTKIKENKSNYKIKKSNQNKSIVFTINSGFENFSSNFI